MIEQFRKYTKDITKVIFLDLDGTLSTLRTAFSTGRYWAFDPISVATLNHICDFSGAKIVFTSTRAVMYGSDNGYTDPNEEMYYSNNFSVIKSLCEKAGLDISHIHPVWSCNTNQLSRDKHVNDFLERHPQITHWAIIDDEPSQFVDKEHVVASDFENGISISNFEEICSLLEIALFDAAKSFQIKEFSSYQYHLPFNSFDEQTNNHISKKSMDPS
jgi:hypothetical protein